MGFFEDIARAASGFTTQSFSGPGYEAVWAQLKPWVSRVTTNGALKWIPRAASQMPCQVPEYAHGAPVGPCDQYALETCLICGRPICLSHAFIEGQQGDAVCYLCVVAGVAKAAAPGPAGGAPPGGKSPFSSQADSAPNPDPPPPPDPRVVAKQQAWWARGVLGIQEGVSWNDVKKQYKALSAQHHPDRGGDASRFKNVQKAFEILKLVYGEN